MKSIVDVVIPALNERPNIERVVAAIPKPPARNVWVCDNGSTDGTGDLAAQMGARVVREERRGYGAACLKALSALAPDPPDVVVFCDADGSDDLSQLPELIAPIVEDRADFVVASRALGRADPGALTVQQRAGNRIAATWLRRRFALHASDLGPFRAIGYDALQRLKMRDQNYGWTVEMQIKAAREGLRYHEIPTRYFRREGRSKVSGTVRGTVGASVKILGLLFAYDLLDAL